ncbi:sensor histidine kinase [Raineyella sp. LH-20]|uniref:sensor histidine kinase n=1 Tax=Raineyella sp. LH-20 TaxID=3081204 RepID=UPI002953D0BA|nr:sensor domain-containing protein [Raineyella sp. LH-20]WOP19352.1 sensor domain-containing protein [Raineyella sp. LH-20]
MKRRLQLTLVALIAAVLSVVCLVPAAVTLVSLPLTVLWVGIPLLIGATWVGRRLLDAHRYGAGYVLGRQVARPYRPAGQHRGFFVVVREVVTDEATWRDLLWIGVNATAGLALVLLPPVFLIGAAAAVLSPLMALTPSGAAVGSWWVLGGSGWLVAVGLVAAWWYATPPLVRTWAAIAAGLLGPSRTSVLSSRVAQLTSSRADSVDSAAQEIRRIERDLHDGVQVRLVSLGLTIGLAEELVDARPERARQLLAEAQGSVTATLQDLRRLVHGIHPPVLADRGLVGAVRALALDLPLEIDVRAAGFGADEAVRLPAPVEACAYFVISEALANVVKHSGASRGDILLELAPGTLRAIVRDEGRGGAHPDGGGGLSGMRRRLAAFDGTLTVSSPPGGPTLVTMEMPCEPLSPKTMPSSGPA